MAIFNLPGSVQGAGELRIKLNDDTGQIELNVIAKGDGVVVAQFLLAPAEAVIGGELLAKIGRMAQQ